MKYTPSVIEKLEPNEVFVFGANTAWIHGAGAAKAALKFGAKYGRGGLQGQTYALPTKDSKIKTLPLKDIQKYVDIFIEYAAQHSDLQFLVTPVGCGLAGYKPKDIAPLFIKAKGIKNIILPKEFFEILVDKSLIKD